MRIPLNLLSTALRQEWVEVCAHPKDRALGIGRVLLKEIPGDLFDDLWAAVAFTEDEVERQNLVTPRDPKAIRLAKEAKREARAAVILACVLDHDSTTFASQVPQEDPKTTDGRELMRVLTEMGFTGQEALFALSTGEARKPFNRADCAAFYERCQPDHWFATNLLRSIKRFQSCDTMTPEEYWVANGADPLVKPPEATT